MTDIVNLNDLTTLQETSINNNATDIFDLGNDLLNHNHDGSNSERLLLGNILSNDGTSNLAPGEILVASGGGLWNKVDTSTFATDPNRVTTKNGIAGRSTFTGDSSLVLPEFQFNNLIVGKTYRVTIQANLHLETIVSPTPTWVGLHVSHGTDRITQVRFELGNPEAIDYTLSANSSRIFTATTTTVVAVLSYRTAGANNGGVGYLQTHNNIPTLIQLEELNDTVIGNAFA